MSSVTDYTVANVSIIINYIPIGNSYLENQKSIEVKKNDSFVISVAKVSKNSVSFRNICGVWTFWKVAGHYLQNESFMTHGVSPALLDS